MTSVNNKDDLVQQDFAQLSAGQQKEALEGAFNQVNDCHPATIPIYRYICQKFDEGADETSIPAMLIPAMLDMEYEGGKRADNFKTRYLQKFGSEGKDWCTMTKSQFFKDIDARIVKFKVPGWPAKSIIMSKQSGNHVKWSFVTPKFAWQLIGYARKPIAKYFTALNHNLVQILLQKYVSKEQWNEALQEAVETVDQDLFYSEQPERYHDIIKFHVAKCMNGRPEVSNDVGTADVESEDCVVEVKPLSAWLHGVGQVLGYSFATKKKPVLVLFGEVKQPKVYIRTMCQHHNIELVYIRTSQRKKRKRKEESKPLGKYPVI